MSLAASAASFVSTKSAKSARSAAVRKPSPALAPATSAAAPASKPVVANPAVAPRSRKVSKPAVATVVVDPAPSSIVAMFAEQQVAAPKSAAKSRSKAPDMELVVLKQFKPRTNQLIDRKFENKGNFAQEANWAALVEAISANGGSISYSAAVAVVEAAGKAGNYEKTCNARGFVQGRVRHGHIGTRSDDDGVLSLDQAVALLAG